MATPASGASHIPAVANGACLRAVLARAQRIADAMICRTDVPWRVLVRGRQPSMPPQLGHRGMNCWTISLWTRFVLVSLNVHDLYMFLMDLISIDWGDPFDLSFVKSAS